jgi:hypothetical protein
MVKINYNKIGLVKLYPKLASDRKELLEWRKAKESRMRNLGEYPKALPEKYFDWLSRLEYSGRKKRSNKEKRLFGQIRWVIARQISDLVALIHLLPEEERKIIFTSESLEGLIKAFLSVYDESNEDPVTKNQRVFQIAAMLVRQINHTVAEGALIRSPYDLMLMDTKKTVDYTRIIPILNRFHEVWKKNNVRTYQ